MIGAKLFLDQRQCSSFAHNRTKLSSLRGSEQLLENPAGTKLTLWMLGSGLVLLARSPRWKCQARHASLADNIPWRESKEGRCSSPGSVLRR